MSRSVTLADANILISRTLRDYVVYAAKLGALDLHWSESILDETTRNLITKFGFTPYDADVLVDRLDAYLPTALVEVKKRDDARVAKVDVDPKDRHVLAAALSAHADVVSPGPSPSPFPATPDGGPDTAPVPSSSLAPGPIPNAAPAGIAVPGTRLRCLPRSERTCRRRHRHRDWPRVPGRGAACTVSPSPPCARYQRD